MNKQQNAPQQNNSRKIGGYAANHSSLAQPQPVAQQRSVRAPQSIHPSHQEPQYHDEEFYDSPTHYEQQVDYGEEEQPVRRPRHRSAHPVVQSSSLRRTTARNASNGSKEVIRHHLGAKEMRRILEDDSYIPDILDTEKHLGSQQKAAQRRAQTRRVDNRAPVHHQQQQQPIDKQTFPQQTHTQRNTQYLNDTQDSIEEDLHHSMSPSNFYASRQQPQRQQNRNPRQAHAQQSDDTFDMYHPSTYKSRGSTPHHQMEALPPSYNSPPQQRPTDEPIYEQYYDHHYSQQSQKKTRKRGNPPKKSAALKYSTSSESESNTKKRLAHREKPEKSEEEVEKAALTEGSYAKAHRRKVEFKPYTIDDYKSMKMKTKGLEKLGGLGPDLDNDVLKKRRQKQERMKNYAKLIMKENAEFLSNVPRASPTNHSKTQAKKGADKRERMKEFASQIPKPKLKKKTRSVNASGKQQKSRHDDSHSEVSDAQFDADREPELSELELLEMQHQQDQDWMKDQFGDGYGADE
mmetsp:Transcript_4600/g.17358  ORF Transcript_4600/g.17358 Transcript_4600/m.17358 type:complete len:518 (-) Transcript_4600:1654-3207(-)